MAKRGGTGGVTGGGLSLSNYYAKTKTKKTKQSSPYLYGMFGPCWATVVPWEKES